MKVVYPLSFFSIGDGGGGGGVGGGGQIRKVGLFKEIDQRIRFRGAVE
jgi:hypothetical protein